MIKEEVAIKKWLCLLLTGALTFAITACHHGQSVDVPSNVTDTNTNTHTSPSNAAERSVINNIESKEQADNVLLSVLYNKNPFITAKGTTVYLKEYKSFYKHPEDVGYYEKDNVFIPRDYTFVDLDKDGKKELIVSEAPYADTYLILREENGKIYGYSLYIRWFQSLKQDGSFQSSGGALIHDYNTISFNINTYNISTFAKFYFEANNEKYSSDKYYFEPDYEKSVFEINGKQVSFEEIKQFAEEWDNRPGAEWMEFK